MHRFRLAALAAILSVATSLGGCAAVQPWQRGRLSQPAMQLSPRLGAEFQSHLRPVREGAIGGEGGAGGGCGCN